MTLAPEAGLQPRFRVFIKVENLQAPGSTLGKQVDREALVPLLRERKVRNEHSREAAILPGLSSSP